MSTGTRIDVRTGARLLAAAAIVITVAAVGATVGRAATSTTVVSATVPSATNLTVTACAADTPATQLGTVLPGASARTAASCQVTFGSSNDTSMLRIAQGDGAGTAMATTGMGALQPTGVTAGLFAIDAADHSNVYAVGSSGTILTTTNGGTSWINRTAVSGTTRWLGGVDTVDASTAWAVGGGPGPGEGGIIRKTTNGGAAWTSQTSPTSNVVLRNVDAVSTSVAWVVGDAGTILKTTDGGTTWLSQTSGTTNSLYDVAAVDANIAWTVGAAGTILKTTNGGATWVAQASGTGNQLEGVDAVSTTLAYASGNGGVLRRTVDGTSWTTVVSGAVNDLESVRIGRDGSVFLAEDGGASSKIWRSVDKGSTWMSFATPANSQEHVAPIDALHVYSVGTAGAIARTVATNPVADYLATSADWVAGTNAFGACLESVTNGTPTWTPDGGGDCTTVNADPWRGVPQLTSDPSAKIAQSTASNVQNVQVNLRFGFRASTSQPAGTYLAPVQFEVVAPNA